MSSPHNRPREGSANIFINYRREDSAGHAGRLFDGLSRHFAGRLFMDVDTLEPGVDFVEAIEQAVGACEVLIVVIGREWLTCTDKAGHRRLDNPDDFVRLEVESALSRQIRVIPVLVQDTPMPRADELPPSLAKLARRNAIELSDARWSYDVDRLAETVEEVLEDTGATAPASGPRRETPPPPAALTAAAGTPARSRAWMYILAAAVVLAAAVGLAAGPWLRQTPSDPSPVPVSPADETAVVNQVGNEPAASTTSEASLNGNSRPGVGTVSSEPRQAETPQEDPSRVPTRAPQVSPPLPRPDAVTLRVNEATTAPAQGPAAEPRPAVSSVPAAQPLQVTITSPRNGETVGSTVQVEGTVSGLGTQHLFLGIRQKNGAIYPRGQLFPEANGQWAIQLRSSKEKNFDILLVTSSNEDADRMLLDQRSRDNGLPLLPPGAAIGSDIVTVKKQGKLGGLFNPKGPNGR
jgi:TIR domain-containing protein